MHHKSMRYHYTPMRMAEGKKTNHPSAGKEMEQLDSHTAVGCVKWYKHLESQKFLIKLDIYLPSDLTIPTLCFYSKELKTYLCKDLYKIVYSSLFIVAQNWKLPKCLRDKWMNTSVTPPVEYSGGKGGEKERKKSKKMERSTDARKNINKSHRHYAEGKKQDIKEYTLYDSIYMKLRTGKIKLWWQNQNSGCL